MNWLFLSVVVWAAPAESVPLDTIWRQDLGELEVYQSRALAVSDQGEIAVLDRNSPLAIILAADGSLKARIDRPGQGPGELQSPVEVGWSAAKKAFGILDFANRRISFWDVKGNFVGETPFPGGALFSPAFPDAETAFCARNPDGMNAEPALIRYHLANAETTLIKQYQAPDHDWSTAGNPESPIRIRFRWDPVLLFGMGSDFLAAAFSDENQIEVIDFKGARVRVLQVNLPRFEITDAQIEEGVALLPTALQASARRGVVKPEAWPILRALFVDGKDRVWAIGASRDVAAAHPFLVYDRDGASLGKGEVEKVPNAVDSEALYYFDGDEDDHFYLVKTRHHLAGK